MSDQQTMQRGPRPKANILNWCADALQRTEPTNEYIAQSMTPDGSSPANPTFDEVIDLALAAVTPTGSVGMLLVGVDYFDVVIASYGADIAREILTIVATRIDEVIRPGDALARHDDGFAILWAPDPGAPKITEIAARIAGQFNEPVVTSAGQLPITVSVGIASASAADCADISPRTLHRQARSAVLSAQRVGRAQLAVFDRSVQEQAVESYETERQLHAALRDERVGVHYQPILSLHSGQTVAVEALARWNDDLLGSISPTTFIPIAEESGLIGELGRVVLQAAISQGSAWNQQSAWNHDGQSGPLITVNLSNRQLLDPELIPTIGHLLEEHQLDPRQLCLEISESVVMSDVAASMTILGHMKDLGLRLAIDDFGTGYSSLSYLRRLPVDILKIDQSFVQSIYNRDDRVITKAIIDLAHTLGMTTVAEGVETRLQVEVLHALDCDMAQGFYLHAPTVAKDVDFSIIDFEEPSLSGSHDWSSAPPKSADPYARQ